MTYIMTAKKIKNVLTSKETMALVLEMEERKRLPN